MAIKKTNDVTTVFTTSVGKAVNALRDDFVKDDFWGGMDLDFITVLEMVLGIDRKSATSINDLGVKLLKGKKG
jgi:hypothetical protein